MGTMRNKQELINVMAKAIQYPTRKSEEPIAKMMKRDPDENDLPTLPDRTYREEKQEKHGKKFDDYWITCFSSEVRQSWNKTEQQLVDRLHEIRNAQMPNLPQDGSKGQWLSSKANHAEAVMWLLGEDDPRVGRDRGKYIDEWLEENDYKV